MSNRVLSILAGFIIQTEQIIFRDKPRSSRNGYKNQGVAIQTGFSSKTTYSFENRPIGCVCKTGSKYASKKEIGLAVFETFRELQLAVLVLGLRLAVLLRVLRHAVLLGKLLDGFSLVHTVIYGAHKQAHNKEKGNKGFTVELESGKMKIWR